MNYNWLYIILTILIITSCTNSSPDDLIDTDPILELVKYDIDIEPIIQSQCLQCHNSNSASGGLMLENYTDVRMSTENGSLLDRITRDIGDPLLMPQNNKLPETSIELFNQWQTDGFLEN